MPHYADGTEAQVGDLVYGVSHAGPVEITGKVIQVISSEACQLAIAYIGESSPVLLNIKNVDSEANKGHSQLGWGVVVIPSVAHGDANRFRRVATWSPATS